MSQQREVEYRGVYIKQVPYSSSFIDLGTMGFSTPHAYQVVDEFDDLALPSLIQQLHWSPSDAAMAVDYVKVLGPAIKSHPGKQATTLAYEYNRLLSMRRQLPLVVLELMALEKLARQALDFDEEVKPKAILDALDRVFATRFSV